jgi:hypothetical protein
VQFIWATGASNHNVTPASGNATAIPPARGCRPVQDAPFEFTTVFPSAGTFKFFAGTYGQPDAQHGHGHVGHHHGQLTSAHDFNPRPLLTALCAAPLSAQSACVAPHGITGGPDVAPSRCHRVYPDARTGHDTCGGSSSASVRDGGAGEAGA